MQVTEIKDNRLVGVNHVETPNMSGSILGPRFITMHYTAGPSWQRAVSNFQKPSHKASAHVVIGRDATTTQLAPFNRITWHAGKSFWKPAQGQGRILGLRRLNRFSIGIELVNAGPLRRRADGEFFTWWGARIPEEEVFEVDPEERGSFGRRYWHRFPEEQIWRATEIVQALRAHYSTIEDVLGHSDISPGRKTDPGPAFPLEHIRSISEGRNVC